MKTEAELIKRREDVLENLKEAREANIVGWIMKWKITLAVLNDVLEIKKVKKK